MVAWSDVVAVLVGPHMMSMGSSGIAELSHPVQFVPYPGEAAYGAHYGASIIHVQGRDGENLRHDKNTKKRRRRFIL